jgi:hypothetical protein
VQKQQIAPGFARHLRRMTKSKYDLTLPIREKLAEVVQFLEPFRKPEVTATRA